MRIRNRTSYLETLPEGRAPVSIRSLLTRRAYQIILLGIVVYLVFAVVDRLMYVHGSGQVEIDKTRIGPLHGGQIASFSVAEGDRIHQGQPLALITARRICTAEIDPWLDKLRFDIESKTARLKLLSDRYRTLPADDEQTLLRRALEVDRTAVAERRQIQRERDKLGYSLDELMEEIDILKSRLHRLEARDAAQELPPECFEEAIVAPFDGHVRAVLRQLHEYVDRGETFLIIEADDAPIRVEAYFDTDDLDYLKRGKLVRVSFPDGEQSFGEIDKIYSAAFDASERETDQYQPVTAAVRADLRPWPGNEERRWRRYDRLAVRLRTSQ